MSKNTSVDQPLDATSSSVAETLRQIFITMRPKQWTKNAFVFTALAFSEDRLWTQPATIAITLAAFALFCLASSSIYLVNDLVDIEKDRIHPTKCRRPLASGKLSPKAAAIATVVLVLIALPLAYLLDPDGGFLTVLIVYVVVQGYLYSYFLKNIVLLDIMTVAAGFVLRAVAGAVVLNVIITHWLLVCMGLLALFIAIGKRRHELVLLEQGAGEHRRILQEYSVPMLDQMISIVTASVIIAYSLTTVYAPAVPHEPYPVLMMTVPFVLYGIFRYLYLIHQRDGGGSPDELVLKDMPLAICIALWGTTVMLILYLFRPT